MGDQDADEQPAEGERPPPRPPAGRDYLTSTVDGAAAAAEGQPDILTGLFPP